MRQDHDEDRPRGPVDVAAALARIAITGFGLAGLLRNAGQTKPESWITWFAGLLVMHDAVLAPAMILASAVLLFVVPSRIRPALQATLLIAGSVVLVAVPVLTGEGRLATNPSILPLPYWRNLGVVLGVVAVAGIAAAAWAAHRRRAAAPAERRHGGW